LLDDDDDDDDDDDNDGIVVVAAVLELPVSAAVFGKDTSGVGWPLQLSMLKYTHDELKQASNAAVARPFTGHSWVPAG